jgi:hypothetical protein
MRARLACGSGLRTLAGLTWKTHLRFMVAGQKSCNRRSIEKDDETLTVQADLGASRGV